jgi:hypothetical protein
MAVTERDEGLWWVQGRGRRVGGYVEGCTVAVPWGLFDVDDPSIDWGPYIGKEPWARIDWHRVQQARAALRDVPGAGEAEQLLLEAITATPSGLDERRSADLLAEAARWVLEGLDALVLPAGGHDPWAELRAALAAYGRARGAVR